MCDNEKFYCHINNVPYSFWHKAGCYFSTKLVVFDKNDFFTKNGLFVLETAIFESEVITFKNGHICLSKSHFDQKRIFLIEMGHIRAKNSPIWRLVNCFWLTSIIFDWSWIKSSIFWSTSGSWSFSFRVLASVQSLSLAFLSFSIAWIVAIDFSQAFTSLKNTLFCVF